MCNACKYSIMGRLGGILICSHPWSSLVWAIKTSPQGSTKGHSQCLDANISELISDLFDSGETESVYLTELCILEDGWSDRELVQRPRHCQGGGGSLRPQERRRTSQPQSVRARATPARPLLAAAQQAQCFPTPQPRARGPRSRRSRRRARWRWRRRTSVPAWFSLSTLAPARPLLPVSSAVSLS